jgi:ArsR family transcriptional regulator, arsenate/arsenite/antimonite-responsive transcriptional repressor / arsenate reductase (thioredoxin)
MAPSGPAPPPFVRLAAHPVRWRLLTELAEGDHRVRELVARVEQPQNVVSYHLRLLRDGGLVTATRSSHDGRDSYYHLDLDRCADTLAAGGAALHPALGRPAAIPIPPLELLRRRPAAVLFVCTGNSARSVIAEALLRQHSAGHVSAASAGTSPKAELHPYAQRVLHERFGIDVGDRRPQHLDALTTGRFDHVVTLCDRAREACPEFPDHPRRTHWSVRDPATADADGYPAFERAAADIDTRVRHLLPVLATTERATTERAATDRQEVQP